MLNKLIKLCKLIITFPILCFIDVLKLLSKITSKKNKVPSCTMENTGRTIQEVPGYICDQLSPYKLLVFRIIDQVNEQLERKEFSKYQVSLQSVNKFIFIPFNSLINEKLLCHKGNVTISFNQCNHYIDFLTIICANSEFVRRKRCNKTDFRQFSHIRYNTHQYILQHLSSSTDLMFSEMVADIDSIYELCLRKAELSRLDQFGLRVQHIFLCSKVKTIGKLITYVSTFFTLHYNHNFDKVFIKLYEELSERPFFTKYQELIEESFSRILISDRYGQFLPFYGPKSSRTYILNFRSKYLYTPVYMVSDLIFYSEVVRGNNQPLAYESAEKVRQEFLMEEASHANNV